MTSNFISYKFIQVKCGDIFVQIVNAVDDGSNIYVPLKVERNT